jgi:hypothetical protein
MDFNLVAFPDLKGLDNRGGKTDGKTIPPFGNLHGFPPLDIQGRIAPRERAHLFGYGLRRAACLPEGLARNSLPESSFPLKKL